MATGPNWNAPGATVGLWKVNFQINTPNRGFHMGFHMAELNTATAKANAIKIAKHVLAILPTDAEIFYATITKDDTKKDSKFIRGALGAGLFVLAGPLPSAFDFARTSLLVRFEHALGGSVSQKLGPLPDSVATDGLIIDALPDVENFVGAVPADPTVFTVWKDNYETLVKTLILKTNYVQAGHSPGGEYTYAAWESAFAMRVADKKGGRVFI